MRRAFFAIFLGVTIIAGAIGAFRWARRRMDLQKAAIPPNANTTELRSVPPFSSKEPARYQATRIITSVEYKDAAGQSSRTAISKTFLARDGDMRREEFESGLGRTLVYLEIPEGHFLLSPAHKLYADLNASPAGIDADAGSVAPTGTADFSPERLLNEMPAIARYENLGGDRINERATTKYRVTPRDTAAGSVTLIWIDNALGLPVRSESSSTAGDHPARLTVELRDLRDTVDARVFELPKDYRKVDYRRLFVESGPNLGAQPTPAKQ